MIGELIKNYGEIGALGVFVLVMAWYLHFQTKRQSKREDKHDEERNKREEKRDEIQKEERSFYRDLVKNDLKELHQDSLLNAKLNSESLILQKGMMKELKEHDGQSKKAWKKTIDSLGIIADKLNNN